MKDQKNANNATRVKNFFVPNCKNNLLSLFIVLCGYLLLWLSIGDRGVAPIPAVLSFVFVFLGLTLATVRPTFTVINERKITLCYAFGLWRESCEWDKLQNVYELDYRVGRTRDVEKVFRFEGLECKKRPFFVKSEIERSKKLRELICRFWGEPVHKEEASK